MDTDKTKPCTVCSKPFSYKNKARDKVCSKECRSKAISRSKLKYSELQISQVIELKSQLKTNTEISSITGVKLSKVKEIVKNNDLFLTKDQAQKNARNGWKLSVEDHMKKMREGLTEEVVQKRKKSVALWMGSDRARKIASEKMKVIWSDLNNSPEKRAAFIEKGAVALSEARLGMTTEEFQRRLLLIKKDVEDSKGSVTTLSEKHGLHHVTALRGFHKNGWSSLVSSGISKGQLEIYEFVKSILPEGETVLLNDRTELPMELDVYVPSLGLAIEYNGL